MRFELPHRPVKMADVAEGPRLHHAALHDIERKLSDRAKIGVPRKSLFDRAELALYRTDPGFEVRSHQRADRRIRLVKLERQATNRTAIGAVGFDEGAPV